ncbi:glycoside hydrolase family 88 protein [Natrarchaeobius sp. A-rgal3]|uniref:glycoside hydrolase family 88 protein n=1 Tax=Natrarchaeobius versutus TaxID=1679078 RepID=UPI00350EEA0D
MVLSESTLLEAREALRKRVDATLAEVGDEFPYVRDGSTWETTPNGNWCGGHWIGLLWFARDAALATGDEDDADRYERAARSATETVHEYMPRTSMFCGMNFCYAGFDGYDRTGDRRLYGIGLEGADAMADAFHEGARQIPLGELDIKGPEQFRGPESDHGPSGNRIGAVDNVYTAVTVLWRAYEETGDTRFRDAAISHADRHLDWYVRDDGRTWHHAVFDDDGGLERQYNELAHSEETCWSRGQGWNVAGLARAHAATGAGRYLDALERTVGYYRQRSPADGVPYWDLAAPVDEDTPRDTSAAALVADGLLALPESDDTAALRAYGETILDSLLSTYLETDPDAPNYGAVEQGCFNAPGEYATNTELIWTDYYVARLVEDALEE